MREEIVQRLGIVLAVDYVELLADLKDYVMWM
jgi:hypothetical protein